MVLQSGRCVVRVVAAVLVVLLLAASCGGDDDGGPASGSAGTSEKPGTSAGGPEDPAAVADREAEFSFALNFGATSLDPHRSPSSAGDSLWMRPVYDRLITMVNGESGVELAPQLATSWQYSDDGLSLEFELRDDVTFHDGATFDASVVKANVERAMAEGSTVSSTLASVETVEVVDPTHVVLRLKEPDPSIPWSIATGTVGMMISPNALDNPNLSTQPAGSGPFALVSFQKDAEVVYERWDGYWDADAALVKTLKILTIPDSNARYNSVRSGELDGAMMQTPHDTSVQPLESEGFHVVQAFAPISYGLALHTARAPFDDVRVRRAVSMAFNREQISEELFEGVYPPAHQPFAKGYLGYDPALDEEGYDVEAARALIKEAGAEGAKVEILQNTSAPSRLIAEVAQQSLGDIGLDVELIPTGPSEIVPAWVTGNYDAQAGVILANPEPSLTLATTYLGYYNPGGAPPELAEMAAEGLRLPVGSAEREEHYQEIGKYLVENPIHAPIVQFVTVFLTRPEVVGSERLLVETVGRMDFRGVGIKKT